MLADVTVEVDARILENERYRAALSCGTMVEEHVFELDNVSVTEVA